MTTEPSPKAWEILESQYLHKEPWLTVRKEKLVMPNGNIVPDYYVLEYPDWVNIIAITEDNLFVMVEQYRHGIEATCLELCAGVCDPSDTSEVEAARRELLEETGYGGGMWSEFMRVSPNASATTNFSYCYIARGVKKMKHPALESSEDIVVRLFTADEVKRFLKDGAIIQATMAAPLWKFFAQE